MISQQYTLKELGIHVDNQLRFTNHVNQIVAKAHVRSRLIHECFLSKDRSAIDKACVTYVRPLLEYAYICMVALSVREHLYSGVSAASFYQDTQWPNWLQLLQAACNSRIGKSRVKKTPPGLNLCLQNNFWLNRH